MPEELTEQMPLTDDQLARAASLTVARQAIEEWLPGKGIGASKGSRVDHLEVMEVAQWVMTGDLYHCTHRDRPAARVGQIEVPVNPGIFLRSDGGMTAMPRGGTINFTHDLPATDEATVPDMTEDDEPDGSDPWG